jgi:hypothetical protein
MASEEGNQAPDQIDVPRMRDLRGRSGEIWIRRALAALVVAVPVVALFNIFGQRADTSATSAPAAGLSVHVPSAVRGGLLFEARFTVTARQDLADAVLELSPRWGDGLTINTVEPAPSEESSDNGWLQFDLGSLNDGDRYTLHLEYQVNPTSVGGRDLGVKLLDGTAEVVSIHRHLRVWP